MSPCREFFWAAIDHNPKTAVRFGGTMIDALLNVAVFAVLVLIIVGSDCAHRVR
jgi:hypothetical protein